MRHTPWFTEGRYWAAQVIDTTWMVATLGWFVLGCLLENWRREG